MILWFWNCFEIKEIISVCLRWFLLACVMPLSSVSSQIMRALKNFRVGGRFIYLVVFESAS